MFQLDYGQLKLVFEALHERKTLLRNAPHLAHPIPIATPCYHLWEVPYYWAGMKAYDLVAGLSGLTMSRFCNAAESLALFPTLAARDDGDGDDGDGDPEGGECTSFISPRFIIQCTWFGGVYGQTSVMREALSQMDDVDDLRRLCITNCVVCVD